MSTDRWQPAQRTIEKYRELGYTQDESYELALEEESNFRDLEDLEDDSRIDFIEDFD